MRIGTITGGGRLLLDADGPGPGAATIVVAGQAIAAADIVAGRLSFIGDRGGVGNGYAAFTFQVRDDGGTANGGVDRDVTPNTLTFDSVAIDVPPATFPSVISLASLGANGFKIQGVTAGDNLGRSVAAAGDINGDGFADIVVGADMKDRGTFGGAGGAAYVLFGKPGGFGSVVNPATLTAANGFSMTGFVLDSLGYSVAGAGDVNNDGFDDLIVGAPGVDAGGINRGTAYVIFGKAGGFGTSINLDPLVATQGFRLPGSSDNAQAGFAVASAGDVNSDGIADLIVTAYFPDTRGAVYVVYGRATGFGSGFTVQSLTPSAGFTIFNGAADSAIGISASAQATSTRRHRRHHPRQHYPKRWRPPTPARPMSCSARRAALRATSPWRR